MLTEYSAPALHGSTAGVEAHSTHTGCGGQITPLNEPTADALAIPPPSASSSLATDFVMVGSGLALYDLGSRLEESSTLSKEQGPFWGLPAGETVPCEEATATGQGLHPGAEGLSQEFLEMLLSEESAELPNEV